MHRFPERSGLYAKTEQVVQILDPGALPTLQGPDPSDTVITVPLVRSVKTVCSPTFLSDGFQRDDGKE